MTVQWRPDPEANATLWREMWEMARQTAHGSEGWAADLGGASGSIPIEPGLETGVRLVTIDTNRAVLSRAIEARRPILADVRYLPIRDGILDVAVARAVLHHVPDDLELTLQDTRRALKPGGLLLVQEPTSGNVVANLARRWCPTELHDPEERPLDWDAYVDAVGRHFEFLQVRPYFLASYLLPHLVARLPAERRALGRALTRFLFVWDQRFLAKLEGARRHAAYIAILARRSRRPGPDRPPSDVTRPPTK